MIHTNFIKYWSVRPLYVTINRVVNGRKNERILWLFKWKYWRGGPKTIFYEGISNEFDWHDVGNKRKCQKKREKNTNPTTQLMAAVPDKIKINKNRRRSEKGVKTTSSSSKKMNKIAEDLFYSIGQFTAIIYATIIFLCFLFGEIEWNWPDGWERSSCISQPARHSFIAVLRVRLFFIFLVFLVVQWNPTHLC